MKVLVTGARGKVGRAAVAALAAAGHEVMATDLARPRFERDDPGEPAYWMADLSDAGDAFALCARGFDAVVHAAAIPAPTGNPPHFVFQQNLMATFNLVEAAIRFGVKRFVYISSETVPGFFFTDQDLTPDYAPVDEEHPIRPQDPYGLSKYFGELLMDAAVRRSDMKCISLRPTWVQWEGNYEQNLGPQVRDAGELSANLWSYVDVHDLADAIVLAAGSGLPGHEVFYIASPDNTTGEPFADIVRRYYGDAIELRPTERPDAGGISIAKARRLLGYHPTRSWRDYLDDNGRRRVEDA